MTHHHPSMLTLSPPPTSSISSSAGLVGFARGITKGVDSSTLQIRHLQPGTRSASAVAKRLGRLGVARGLATSVRLEAAGRGVFLARRTRRTYEVLQTRLVSKDIGDLGVAAKPICGALSGAFAWFTTYASLQVAAVTGSSWAPKAAVAKQAVKPRVGMGPVAMVAAVALPIFDVVRRRHVGR